MNAFMMNIDFQRRNELYIHIMLSTGGSAANTNIISILQLLGFKTACKQYTKNIHSFHSCIG